MKVRSFSHVGITVSDFNRFVKFYWEIFGCPLVGVADTPPERVRAFFNVDAPSPFDAAHGSPGPSTGAGSPRAQSRGERSRELPRCKIGWIRVPGGGVLEIFHFEPHQPAVPVPWNRIGQTHFSFNVRHLQRWYDYLQSKGVECVSRPERSPRGHWFFFARDFDGNLIELMDLGYMYYVLGWLGPLGGWLFRRGMYRQYYM